MIPAEFECSWCGSDHTDQPNGKPYANRRGEFFCTKAHRSANARALKQFIQRTNKKETS